MHDFANEVLQAAHRRSRRVRHAHHVCAARRPRPQGRVRRRLRRRQPGPRLERARRLHAARLRPGRHLVLVLIPTGMFITTRRARRAPDHPRARPQHGRASICGGRVVFSSTRDGNSEIYSSNLDGGDVRRLTNDPGIDVSPACGPGGQIAFVSTRHGSPQIWTMSSSGGGQKRVTYKGEHNQTPAWCPDPKKQLLAFTGPRRRPRRLHDQPGDRPVHAPDAGPGHQQGSCVLARLPHGRVRLARGGIYISNPQGLNRDPRGERRGRDRALVRALRS